MSDRYYVLLTGPVRNAGDFLIRMRARNLLQEIRPDRKIVELSRQIPLTPTNIETVNGAEALLLTGGPALRPNMYPGVYPLVDDLESIKCPIMTFGIGWGMPTGDLAGFAFGERTRALLAKIDSSGFPSSLRDYHAAAVLERNGCKSFRVTGCPALYASAAGDVPLLDSAPVRRVGFSLGVGFVRSRQLECQAKDLIQSCGEWFPGADLVVSFHHGFGPDPMVATVPERRFWSRQCEFRDWLKEKGIAYIDISGSEDRLLTFYDSVDLHIGYRVHAHVFMLSTGKPSVLIAEDGRGLALRDVVGGSIFNAYWSRSPSRVVRVLSRLGFPRGYRMNDGLDVELGCLVRNSDRLHRNAASSRTAIAAHAATMRDVIRAWP